MKLEVAILTVIGVFVVAYSVLLSIFEYIRGE